MTIIEGITRLEDQEELVAKVNASLPEAPTDSASYARRGSDASWQPISVGGGGVAVATVADAAPGSPVSGQLWFDSDRGALFIYYDSTWVQLGAVT